MNTKTVIRRIRERGIIASVETATLPAGPAIRFAAYPDIGGLIPIDDASDLDFADAMADSFLARQQAKPVNPQGGEG